MNYMLDNLDFEEEFEEFESSFEQVEIVDI
jgi:hypothetical protein